MNSKLRSWLEQYQRYLFPLWFLVSLGASLAKLKFERHNNFTIFHSSWGHLSQHLPLYCQYPEQYNDLYLYGPTFAFLMAPLGVLPNALAYLLWCVGMACLLFYAIAKLPMEQHHKSFIALFSLNELVTGLMMQQFNVIIGALIILSFVFVKKERELWATLFMALGLTTKIYGIVALAFFPFSKHKVRYILYSFMWTALLLALPLLVGKDYVLGQYASWIEVLSSKNEGNLFALMQNISLLGMIRKISGLANYSDLIPILGGMLLFALPYLRFSQYKAKTFPLFILASTLLFVVLFSTGSESSSYIILFPAVGIWYVSRWKARTKFDLCLLIGTFILSSLSPTDLFPRFIREAYILPYALKAFFPSLVWFKLSYELLFVDFLKEEKSLSE